MTAKKGMLWKSPWNRARGAPEPPIQGEMRFFRNFFTPGPNTALYGSVNPSTLGGSLPFWFAYVGMRGGTGAFSNPAAFTTVEATSVDGNISTLGLLGGNLYQLSLDAPGEDNVCAVIVNVTGYVTPGPPATFYRFRVIMDDQVSQLFTSLVAYTPVSGDLVIAPGALPTCLHGICGGPGTVSLVESKAWFKSLKSNLVLPEVPGKTTHYYAAPIGGSVPVLLANAGSAGAAQDLAYIVTAGTPTPENALLPVRFPY